MSLRLVKRHGSPNWSIRGTVRGVTVDETTGTDVREAAEAIRAKREWQITEGSIFGRRHSSTFLEAAVSYLDAGGEVRFIKVIADYFGSQKLETIDQAAIDAAARKLYPNAKPSTLNRQLYTPVSAVLKHAALRDLTQHRVIQRPAQPVGRIRHISIDEANRLLECCAPHLRPVVTFLFYTGARVSEALLLEWEQVDLSRAHAAFSETKNGHDRGVPLHARVVAALANLPHRSGRVFLTNRGKPYRIEKGDDHGGQIKTAFKGACRRAGVTNFRPHDCRHSWATWHYKKWRNLLELKELGGWSSMAMVARYAHVNMDHLAASIEGLPWGNSGEPDPQSPETSTKRKA